MRKALLILALAVTPGVAFADLIGRVVNVHDGDRVTVLVDGKPIRVRLEGIDAPELGQAFGKNSRQSLANLCAGKEAVVVDRGKDRYKGIVGRVTCASVEANAEQVRRGMAWVYMPYVPLGSPLYEFESYARLQQVGLWADPKAIPPWEWRARRKNVK